MKMHTSARLSATLFASLPLAACVTAPRESAPVTVQILAVNDFHGNLESPPGQTRWTEDGVERSERLGGAAQLGATLATLRTANTVTVAAGDLIGASPLASSLFLDEPTVAALSAVGLDIASVGNHEFDRGVAELRRMQDGGCARNTRREPCALEPFAGAGFQYLAANVVDNAGRTAFPATALREIGGAKIGFIGMTLENTANLVAGSATAGYTFLDEADTANRYAAELRAAGADAVVVLVHEGADVDPTYNLTGCPGLGGDIVPILQRLDPSISLVVSGHTHQAYVCQVARPDGSDVLLTSGGRYGGFVTDITLTVDPGADRVVSVSGRNVPVLPGAGSHPQADAIVRRYVAAAGPVAGRAVGPIADSGVRGEDCADRPADGLVADAQLAAANAAMDVPVDLAFMNSGGVRTDLSGAADGVLTYGELAAMQPFNNGIAVLEMTGAQVLAALEQQFCNENPATICSSGLTPSANASYTADLSRPAGQRVTGFTLNGQPLDPARTYVVALNSFLAGGGDGFSVLREGRELGLAGFDIDALEAYVATGNASVPVCGRVRRTGTG